MNTGLMIGGPKDGMWVAQPSGRAIEVVEYAERDYAVKDVDKPCNSTIKTSFYRPERYGVGGGVRGNAEFFSLYIHESITMAQAMQRLIENYRPISSEHR